ncbi:hypothetical protein RND71_031172 [Anisodus tanguticus]|uniref:Uncharacterized protein n=1 Tax=Anisodus tanguticus TaxID=243964 RepID=A0AAE1RCQ3_9SOLA|nr:hypothetical protein RND71_031172 [Anisodus tanguticus]
MNPIDDKKETVTLRGVSHDEEGKTKVTKLESDTHNIESLKHIEKKLIDKGIHRKDRRPIDGIPLNKQSKSGHGGKFTWEGPRDVIDDDVPAAIDENDPNYVDEEEEGKILRGEVSGVEGLVVGEVDVAKVVDEGVGRVDVVDRVLQENM